MACTGGGFEVLRPAWMGAALLRVAIEVLAVVLVQIEELANSCPRSWAMARMNLKDTSQAFGDYFSKSI